MPTLAETAAFAAAQRVLDDLAAATTCLMCSLGDELGLFRELAEGPATSEELAERAGVAERYTREWLHALTAADYLEHDPETDEFGLPTSLVPVLADDRSPTFLGGGFDQVLGLAGALDAVAGAFRDGGGLGHEAYPDVLWRGMERMSGAWIDGALVTDWLPRVDGLVERLEAGAELLEIGCGNGRALVALARAFPRSRFAGIDSSPRAVRAARRNAATAGVGDRVTVDVRDARDGLVGRYDAVAMFDVLHDIADPGGVLRSIRSALAPGGACIVLELNAAEEPAGNFGPIGALLYATSVAYCVPTALADGAPGYGTLGLPPSRVAALAGSAGFARVRDVGIGNPFNALYELRP